MPAPPRPFAEHARWYTRRTKHRRQQAPPQQDAPTNVQIVNAQQRRAQKQSIPRLGRIAQRISYIRVEGDRRMGQHEVPRQVVGIVEHRRHVDENEGNHEHDGAVPPSASQRQSMPPWSGDRSPVTLGAWRGTFIRLLGERFPKGYTKAGFAILNRGARVARRGDWFSHHAKKKNGWKRNVYLRFRKPFWRLALASGAILPR